MIKPDASIIILTKNAGDYFTRTLDAIFSQKCRRQFEIIIIDSGSTDQTLNIVGRYPVRVIEIKPEEFGHGRTRNLGVKLASGRFLVFLTQDAIPASDEWLDNLLRNLDDPSVAGVYGGQIPRVDTNPVNLNAHNRVYAVDRIVREGYSDKSGMLKMLFSNVNSAMRAENLRDNPFCENLVHGEDQEWSKRMLLMGFKTIYDPEAAVIHSHNYTLKDTFRRLFDTGASFSRFAPSEYSYNEVIKYGLRQMVEDIIFLQRDDHIKWIPIAVLYNLCKFLAVTLGKKERYLPRSLKRQISQNSAFWR